MATPSFCAFLIDRVRDRVRELVGEPYVVERLHEIFNNVRELGRELERLRQALPIHDGRLVFIRTDRADLLELLRLCGIQPAPPGPTAIEADLGAVIRYVQQLQTQLQTQLKAQLYEASRDAHKEPAP